MEYLRKRDVEFRGRHAVLYWMRRGPGGEEELRLAEPDGTLIADDLMPVPEDMDPEDWFETLRPELMPVWTAESGKTEKRMIVRMREMEDRMDRLEAFYGVPKDNDLEIPRFLAPDPLKSVPAGLQDLAKPGETAAEMQARLWSLWLELNGKLMLGLATADETILHSRLHNELHWFAPALEGEL